MHSSPMDVALVQSLIAFERSPANWFVTAADCLPRVRNLLDVTGLQNRGLSRGPWGTHGPSDTFPLRIWTLS